MKFLCDQCGETVEAASIRVDDGEVVLTCPVCGFENRALPRAEKPPRATAEDAASHDSPNEAVSPEPQAPLPSDAAKPAMPRVRCPKCFHWQPETTHCHKCGLDLTRAGELAAAWEVAPAGQEAEHEEALVLWKQVEGAIQSKAEHDQIDRLRVSDLAGQGVRIDRSPRTQ